MRKIITLALCLSLALTLAACEKPVEESGGATTSEIITTTPASSAAPPPAVDNPSENNDPANLTSPDNDDKIPLIVQDFEKITRNMTPDDVNAALGNTGVVNIRENPFQMDEGATMTLGEYEITYADIGGLGVWEYPEGKIEVLWLSGDLLRKSIDLGYINTTLLDNNLIIEQAVAEELLERFESSGLTYDDIVTTLGTAGVITKIVYDDGEPITYLWADKDGLNVYAAFADGECLGVSVISSRVMMSRSSGTVSSIDTLAETLAWYLGNP